MRLLPTEQTKGRCDSLPAPANESTDPRIVSADMTDRGIIVTFADGKCALYTSSFLRGKFLYAEIIPEDEQANSVNRQH